MDSMLIASLFNLSHQCYSLVFRALQSHQPTAGPRRRSLCPNLLASISIAILSLGLERQTRLDIQSPVLLALSRWNASRLKESSNLRRSTISSPQARMVRVLF